MSQQTGSYDNLCQGSLDYMIIIYVWFTFTSSASIWLLLYTAYMARSTKQKIDQATGDWSDEESDVGDVNVTDDPNYEVRPPELKRRKKSSHLEDIAEDDESEASEGESYRKGSSYSFSTESKISTPSLISTSSSYSRSNSTAECFMSGNSLAVPSKSNLKRTESQSRADYVIRMMAQGGNIRDYSSPNNIKEKYSPTGRKISVDSKVRFQTELPSQRSSTSGLRIHTYENLPQPTESMSGTERRTYPHCDSESTTV